MKTLSAEAGFNLRRQATLSRDVAKTLVAEAFSAPARMARDAVYARDLTDVIPFAPLRAILGASVALALLPVKLVAAAVMSADWGRMHLLALFAPGPVMASAIGVKTLHADHTRQ